MGTKGLVYQYEELRDLNSFLGESTDLSDIAIGIMNWVKNNYTVINNILGRR